ncbi:hypothetical protein NZD48_08240 [Staphylococcus hyicus]|uniref:hypothetical protein n=1 Tax=Staphylococcus hyicus TaxID=1284 RepID=UPI00217D935E|nr:hypothetical protein [Staphylococcus hyicus]UWF56042.1 hypothetical protein NZD48_08240 [Staphylococcus hyicus]
MKVDYKRIWQDLKERKIRSFTLLHENAKVKKDKYYVIELNKLSSELCEMDTLDGTQDFQNLLHDLKRVHDDDPK